jgi:hypothetical protein
VYIGWLEATVLLFYHTFWKDSTVLIGIGHESSSLNYITVTSHKSDHENWQIKFKGAATGEKRERQAEKNRQGGSGAGDTGELLDNLD